MATQTLRRRPGRRLLAGAVAVVACLTGCSQIQLGSALGQPTAEAPGLPLGLSWERDADGAFGPSAAHVTDRYVVVGTRAGEVVVLDRESGRVAGSGEFGQSVEGQLAASADGETIYVPTAEKGGGVEAYDVRRGRQRWRWRGGAVEGGVALVGDVLVVAALDGRVVGLDAATGEVRWERPPVSDEQIHAAPVPIGTDVLVADDRGRVTRVDVQTGMKRWEIDAGGPVYATPVVAFDVVYVSTTRGAVGQYDVETGGASWRFEAGRTLRASSVAVGDGTVAVGLSDGTVRAFDELTGAERWRFETDGNVTAAPAWIGDRLAVGTLDKRLVLLDGADGRELWSTELRGRVKSALAVGGGLLVALVEPRHVVAFHTAP